MRYIRRYNEAPKTVIQPLQSTRPSRAPSRQQIGVAGQNLRVKQLVERVTRAGNPFDAKVVPLCPEGSNADWWPGVE